MFFRRNQPFVNSQNVAFVNRFQTKDYEDSMRLSTAFCFRLIMFTFQSP